MKLKYGAYELLDTKSFSFFFFRNVVIGIILFFSLILGARLWVQKHITFLPSCQYRIVVENENWFQVQRREDLSTDWVSDASWKIDERAFYSDKKDKVLSQTRVFEDKPHFVSSEDAELFIELAKEYDGVEAKRLEKFKKKYPKKNNYR